MSKNHPGKEPEESIPDRGNCKCKGQVGKRLAYWEKGKKASMAILESARERVVDEVKEETGATSRRAL